MSSDQAQLLTATPVAPGRAEFDALGRYAADSNLMHAFSQGWLNLLLFSEPRVAAAITPVQARIAQEVGLIKDVISRSHLVAGRPVFSGHGDGRGIIGSMRGPPASYLGMQYAYDGLISTSWQRGRAEFHLQRNAGRHAVLLEFNLDQGFPAFDMAQVPGNGSLEAEILLWRGRFEVVAAQDAVITSAITALHLVLNPV